MTEAEKESATKLIQGVLPGLLIFGEQHGKVAVQSGLMSMFLAITLGGVRPDRWEETIIEAADTIRAEGLAMVAARRQAEGTPRQ
jgi:hypothetical protein